MSFERRTAQPENPFSRLVPDQTIAIVPEFTFESGYTIRQVPVAYKTWGVLNEARDNVMLICHPLTRSVNVEDWWVNIMGRCPLEGKGKTIDETKFFIICLNVMGSPYGTASPLTLNPETGTRYGPEFPLATIRDDVRLHKMVLDEMGIKSIAICIGGSMAGMQVFEWAFYGPEYIKLLVPISAPCKGSAWSISWTESQRQSIFADPKYLDGYYALDNPPRQGMTAARMCAMLTYRTRLSYERRFGRNIMDNDSSNVVITPSNPPTYPPAEYHRQIHNEGHQLSKIYTTTPSAASPDRTLLPQPSSPPASGSVTPTSGPTTSQDPFAARPSTTILHVADETGEQGSQQYRPPIYAAHSYLRYQADKFIERFDANCYIALCRKMDFHDISAGRGEYEDIVRSIQQPTLVIGIESDVLYPKYEIEEMSDLIPHSQLYIVPSTEGHDGLLLEYELINDAIVAFMQKQAHIQQILRQPSAKIPEREGPRGGLFASW